LASRRRARAVSVLPRSRSASPRHCQSRSVTRPEGLRDIPLPRLTCPNRESLKMTLEYDGYEVLGAATGQEGLALVERDTPDLVLLDVKMPGMDGLDV